MAMAVLVLLVAAYLTARVTSLDGGPYILSSQPKDGLQSLGVFVPSDDSTPEIAREIGVAVFSRIDPDKLYISVRLPQGQPVKLLIDNLSGLKACSSPRTVDQVVQDEIEGGGINVDIALVDDNRDQPLYAVTPTVSEFQDDFVVCEIISTVTEHTFIQKQLTLRFISELTFIDVSDHGFAGYDPLPGYRAKFIGIAGAHSFRFDSGFQESDLEGYEAVRTLIPGSFVEVTWSDIFREQARDIDRKSVV